MSADWEEIFELQKRHTRYTFSPYKNFFLNKIVSIFTFASSIISIITTTLVIYLFCKHKHIRTIVASLLLHKAKEVEARIPIKIDNSECGTLAYIGITLTLLSKAIVILLHYRKSKFCRGHRFSNVKIVLFISDVQHYIPIKLCKTSGSLHQFKITGTLTSEDIRLNKNYLWDTIEINWDKIKLSFNSNEIKLPQLVMIKMQDKIRVRRMMTRETQNFHIMTKQGMTWYNLETVYILKHFILDMACLCQPKCNFLHGFLRCNLPVEVVDVEVKIMSMRGCTFSEGIEQPN